MPENNNLSHIDIRSEEVQEILTRVPHWIIRWGSIVFLSLIIMLLYISWLVKYPDIILSEATITTQIPPQKEYAQTTGAIDAILVKDSQEVNKNQALAILESSANYQDVYKLKSIIDTITVNSKFFNFPIDSLPLLFLGDIESQFALFENNYIQYQLNRQYQPFLNEAFANEYSIIELKRRLRSLKVQQDINKTELDFAKKDLNRQKILFDNKVIPAQEYEKIQLEYAQSERNYKNFEALISQIRESINTTQIALKGTEINRIKEEMTLLKAVIQSFNQLKKAIKDWERLYVLKSNIEGKVSFLNYWNSNQTVNQGDLVFTIIPSKNSSFIGKLKTPAQNSGKIKVGQRVNIKLENYPDSEFGVINGIVKNISPVTILNDDKEGIYFIDVELPKKLITSFNKEIEFKQEMRGSAEIVTDNLRFIERIFQKFDKLFERN